MEELWNLQCHKHAGPAPTQSRSGISEPLEGSASRWWLLANASIKTNLRDVGETEKDTLNLTGLLPF